MEEALPEFGELEPWLFRGGQPTDEGYRQLSQRGIRCIVNVCTHEESNDMAQTAPDLEPVHIPVKDHHPPTLDQARQWLTLCNRHRTGDAVYVHCKNGHGRASTFSMLVRLAQGWSLDRAMEEQIRYGFPESEKAQIEFLREVETAYTSGSGNLPRLDA